MTYKSQEEVEKEFGGKFPPPYFSDAHHGLFSERNGYSQPRDLMNFISQVRLSDLEGIVEKMKSLPKLNVGNFECESDIEIRGVNHAKQLVSLDDILSYLQSLKK